MKLFTRLLNLIFRSKVKPLPRTAPVQRGFYGSDALQPFDVAGFTDVHWESFFSDDLEVGFQSIKDAAKPAVIDVYRSLYGGVPGDRFLFADAEVRLRAFRAQLEASGAMKYVYAIYPIDEPDHHVQHRPDIHDANMICRKVFPDQELFVIYAQIQEMPYIEDYDKVAVDGGYDEGDGILDVTLQPFPPRSDFDRLLEKLEPHQQAFFCVGSADPYRTALARFIQMAEKFGQVWGIIGFLWIDRKEGETVYKGIRNNGMASEYKK